MPIKKIREFTYPILSQEVLRQRKKAISAETMLDCQESTPISEDFKTDFF